MSEWTPEELHAISEVEEIQLAPLQADGTPRRPVVMWVVTNGTDVFVRSVLGTSAGWYRHVTETGRARLTAGEVDREVGFEPVNEVLNQAVTDAYKVKYAEQSIGDLLPMTEGPSIEATLKVVPA
jgi:hypothetical protein